jgi:hypothetical protein
MILDSGFLLFMFTGTIYVCIPLVLWLIIARLMVPKSKKKRKKAAAVPLPGRRRKRGGLRKILRPGEGDDYLSDILWDADQYSSDRLDAGILLLRSDYGRALGILTKLVRSAREESRFRAQAVGLVAEAKIEDAVPVLMAALRSRDPYVREAAEAKLSYLGRRRVVRATVAQGLVRSIRSSRFAWRYMRHLRLLCSIALVDDTVGTRRDVLTVLSGVLRRQPLDTSYGRDAVLCALDAYVNLAPASDARDEVLYLLHGQLDRLALGLTQEEADFIRYKLVNALAEVAGVSDIAEFEAIARTDSVERIRLTAEKAVRRLNLAKLV